MDNLDLAGLEDLISVEGIEDIKTDKLDLKGIEDLISVEGIEDLITSGDPQAARKKLLDIVESGLLADDLKEQLKVLLYGQTPFLGTFDKYSGKLLAIGLAVLIFSVILFFGYKLYKSIKEKEKKKEEKKKLKQMKKKK